MKLKTGTFIRANCSANADIVLSRRDHVLSLNEAWVQYDGPRAFVEVEVAPQRFERRPVEFGLSDGSWVELKQGLTPTTRVKRIDASSAGKLPQRP